MSQITLSQVFSYTFVFLFGMFLGALGEMLWNGRLRKRKDIEEDGLLEYHYLPQDGLTEAPSQPPSLVEKEDSPEALIASTGQGQKVALAGPLPVVSRRIRKTTKPLTMIEQMDEILQDLQHYTGKDRPTIRLMDDGHQNVLIKIGDMTYNGIDAVPDPQAAALIRQAASDWEKHYAK